MRSFFTSVFSWWQTARTFFCTGRNPLSNKIFPHSSGTEDDNTITWFHHPETFLSQLQILLKSLKYVWMCSMLILPQQNTFVHYPQNNFRFHEWIRQWNWMRYFNYGISRGENRNYDTVPNEKFIEVNVVHQEKGNNVGNAMRCTGEECWLRNSQCALLLAEVGVSLGQQPLSERWPLLLQYCTDDNEDLNQRWLAFALCRCIYRASCLY